MVSVNSVEFQRLVEEQRRGKETQRKVVEVGLLDDEGLRKKLRYEECKSRRKANKALRKIVQTDWVDQVWYGKTNVRLAPHNTAKGTDYLMPFNMKVLVVEHKTWLALYMVDAYHYDNIGQIQRRAQYVRAAKHEVRRIDHDVIFRAEDSVLSVRETV